MQSERLIDYQIQVRVVNQGDKLVIQLSNDQEIIWPIQDIKLSPGLFYLTLSPKPTLPDKEELVKMILKEIFKVNE